MWVRKWLMYSPLTLIVICKRPILASMMLHWFEMFLRKTETRILSSDAIRFLVFTLFLLLNKQPKIELIGNFKFLCTLMHFILILIIQFVPKESFLYFQPKNFYLLVWKNYCQSVLENSWISQLWRPALSTYNLLYRWNWRYFCLEHQGHLRCNYESVARIFFNIFVTNATIVVEHNSWHASWITWFCGG